MAVTRNGGRRALASSSRYPRRSKRPLPSSDSSDANDSSDSNDSSKAGNDDSDDQQDSSQSEPESLHDGSHLGKRRRSTRISKTVPLQPLARRRKRRHAKAPTRTASKTNHQRASQSPAKKRRPLSPSPSPTQHQDAGRLIPDWRDSRIPFECWTNIFYFAASATPGNFLSGWLLHAATTCRLFAEPALTALYRNPCISSPTKAKRLAAAIHRPPSETLFNYRAKVLLLYIDIHVVPQSILYQLIQPLTRLQELIIYTPLDQAPYRLLDKSLRWHYPPSILYALEPDSDTESPNEPRYKPFSTTLQSWEWSARLLGGSIPTIESMKAMHQSVAFSRLTKLTLTNFQPPWLSKLQLQESKDDADDDNAAVVAVADAISQLPKLNHLVFESSSIVDHHLLSLLPTGLVHLGLVNCWQVRSRHLADFLHTHGSELGTLTLLHNQSLDLAFLTNLSQTCPKLRELHVDMLCYRNYRNYYRASDEELEYDQALLPCQVPNWPSSLRVINMEHIRNWSVAAAETCLQSLLDSAHKLPNLRHLTIKAVLDIPWQARATMRREWREKFEAVFLRPFVAPAQHTTLRPPPSKNQNTSSPARRQRTRAATAQPGRRSTRIQAAKQHHSNSRASHRGKSLRKQRVAMSYREPDTDEDEETGFTDSSDDDDAGAKADDDDHVGSNQGKLTHHATGSNGSTQPFVQGLCHTVNIIFDNQKVTELQWGMEDFLNESDESEEDWDGDDDYL